MEFQFGIGMLDSQHCTVAFSNSRNLLTKKAGGEDLVRPTNDPLTTGSVANKFGGADRDRTDDLLNAIQALSQTELQPHLV